MEQEEMIVIDNVSMRFNLGIEKNNSLKQIFVEFLKGKKKDKNQFWALKNIDINIKKEKL